MSSEQAQAKKGSKYRLMGAVMGLALVAGALLSIGSAVEGVPPATSFVETAKPEAAETTATTPDSTDSISPGEENADRDGLDLQLD